MQTLLQLLHLLADGRFYSDEILSKELKIPGTNIAQAMQQLTQLGIEIESMRGNSYRIPGGLALLNKEKILTGLEKHYRELIDELIVLEQVDSTNNFLIPYTRSQKCIVCLTEYQTKGRGRRGREWVAAFGHNLYCSLLWHFHRDPSEMIGLSLAIAIAVIRSLQHYGIYLHLGVKWPNDILHAGKKLGGILIDIFAESPDQCSVIIGIGLNTYLPPAQSTHINQAHTHIKAITGEHPCRNQLAALLIQHTLIALTQFTDHGFIPFLEEWHTFDQLLGKAVILSMGNTQIQGYSQGVSPKGELILLDEQQHPRYFLSGDITLRQRYTS